MMHKIIIAVLAFLLLLTAWSFAEDLTITTYYPAPYGSYAELRARRMALGPTYSDSSHCWPPAACANQFSSTTDLAVEEDANVDGNTRIGTTANPNSTLTVNGRIGVGTTTITDPVTVYRDGLSYWDTNRGHIKLTNGMGRSLYLIGAGAQALYATNDFYIRAAAGVGIYSGNSQTAGVCITSTGRVGISCPYMGWGPTHTFEVAPGGTTWADAWSSPSSIRWKKNIKPISKALEKVMQLRGVSFDWKENNKHGIGLIAEEVDKVIPEVVAYNPNSKEVEGLDYSRLTAVLVEAIKSQQLEINSLKSEISKLKKSRK